MPSIRSGSRRPRSAKARNRGKGYVLRCGVRYRELSSARNFGFEAGRFSPAASLECVYNFGVMARGLLNGDLRFRPMCDCLLYTSDAADDLLCVDLGGRCFIKKKK